MDDGRLVPGDILEFHYGGRGGAQAPRVSDEATEFTVLLDRDGTGNYDAQPGSPVVRTTPGPAVGFAVVAPPIVRARDPIAVHVKTVDALGNLVPMRCEVDIALVAEDRAPVLQTAILDACASAASVQLGAPAEGVWRIEVRDRTTGHTLSCGAWPDN